MIDSSTDLTYGDSTYPKPFDGKPGRDEEIEKVIQSIRAAGKVGLPVIEYNFYAHRATEGYFETTGRGGAGITSFDYERVKDLPPLPEEGAHTNEEMWSNITYFLKAVVPVAEQSNVRLALHPNNPPAPLSRGSQQIMGTLAGWKKLIDIVPSKSNGITFDCGVTREMGENPVEVCRYFASRDRINHVHYRNVLVEKPYERYSETFPDAGMNNMFAVMRELVNNKYRFLLHPEHPRALDYDRAVTDFKPYYPGAVAMPALLTKWGMHGQCCRRCSPLEGRTTAGTGNAFDSQETSTVVRDFVVLAKRSQSRVFHASLELFSA